ncbi:hypothetical protein Q8F55_006360 [Vanrija albida]|uniref:DUF5753 domain-containing protein n=1 Tax=Vanrija albida TaxID=181172 RepID=A0ABR3PWZ4_9TREE
MSNNPAQTSSMFGHPGQQAGTSNSPAQQAHLPNNPAEQPGQSLPPAQQIIVGAPLTPAQARDLQTIEKQRAHQRTIDRIVGAGRPWWLIPLTQVEISVLLDNKIRLVSQLGGRDILYLHDFTRRVPHQPLYDAMLGVEDRGLDPELLDLIETLRNEAYDHIIGQPSTSAIRTSAADEASAIAPVPDPHPSAPNPINGAATYAPAPHDSVAYDSGPFHPAASGSAARGSAVHVPPATVDGYNHVPAAQALPIYGPVIYDPVSGTYGFAPVTSGTSVHGFPALATGAHGFPSHGSPAQAPLPHGSPAARGKSAQSRPQ